MGADGFYYSWCCAEVLNGESEGRILLCSFGAYINGDCFEYKRTTMSPINAAAAATPAAIVPRLDAISHPEIFASAEASSVSKSMGFVLSM